MQQLRWLLVSVLALLLSYSLVGTMAAQSFRSLPKIVSASPGYSDDPVDWLPQFVPESPSFWNDSQYWTSNYGPAYRDTITTPSQMLACTSQFALCFHSGAGAYPCHLSPDGRTANCRCTVSNSTNFTLINAILNYSVYVSTVKLCGADGSLCSGANQAPVCDYVKDGSLIPGADVISTFDPDSHDFLAKAIMGKELVTVCPKAPYAGCMTAPCKLNSDGSANCKCSVFYGVFQLAGQGATCSLGGDMVPSASYVPILDSNPPK